MPIMKRIQRALNAFAVATDSRSNAPFNNAMMGSSTSSSPHTPRLRFYNDRSLVSSIYTRIAIDVAGIEVRHVKLDDQNRYSEDIPSALNSCFTLEPNLDQGPRAFVQDFCTTLFDKGVCAIVPIDIIYEGAQATGNYKFDVLTMRVGEITAWFPKHIRVSVYNEATGVREEITVEKRYTAIVENPLYAVMNEPNSTLQRLIRKLYLLDAVDEQSSSGKLDLIIQLPYVIKSEAKRDAAEKRRKEIEFQLKGSQYGIAYTDGTEKVTQLNRPAENNLFKQVEYLVGMLYGQLGITDAIMNGTADEATMINYFNRTIEPILDAYIQAFQRSIIGQKRTEDKERVKYFRNPFKLIPVAQLAEVADKFTRNEIFSSNEIRGFIGVPPSKDPKADQLINSNMPQSTMPPTPPGPSLDDMDKVMSEVFDGLSKDIDKIAGGVG